MAQNLGLDISEGRRNFALWVELSIEVHGAVNLHKGLAWQ